MTRGTVFSRRALPPVAALRAFDAVARLGGVRRAAEALEIDHAAVSRQLRLLESWTGARLVVRTSGGVSLTPTGRAYHDRIAGALETLAASTLALIQEGATGRLHIWCVPGFASKWLMPRLENFQALYPGLAIELRPTDAAPNFANQEADVQILYMPDYGAAPGLPAGVHHAPFAHASVFPVASPEFLLKVPPFETAADLLGRTLIQERNFENWRTWFARQGIPAVGEAGGPRLWHGHLTVDAARRGRGVALVNHFLAADELVAGALKEVVSTTGPFPPVLSGRYHLIASPDRWSSPAVARLFRWLCELAAEELAAAGPRHAAAQDEGIPH